MDKPLATPDMKQIERTIHALQANGMKAIYAPGKKDVKSLVEGFLQPGDTVTCGGSMTLNECGIISLLQSGDYDFLDRNDPEITKAQIDLIYRKTFFADAYLCSSNAITENGELYNVDGNCNRVAAMLFGPKSVIVVAGYNKIVPNLTEAVRRVKTEAAPKNCVRLHKNTYCAQNARCADLNCNDMTSGCCSPERICSGYTVIAQQKSDYKNRIKVILVGEPLGF